jgi:hypothetical protein
MCSSVPPPFFFLLFSKHASIKILRRVKNSCLRVLAHQ